MTIVQGDIARKLNLSIATVSRSLRNDRSIHPETRARVIQLASQMGYQTRSISGLRQRSKAGNSTKTVKPICVLIQSDIRLAEEEQAREYLVVHRTLAGITQAAGELHTHAIIHYIQQKDRDRADDPSVLPAVVRNNQTSGLILMNYYPNDVVTRLAEQYPCVSLNTQYANALCDCVAVDSIESVSKLVDRLTQAGHDRIGFLGSDRDFSWNRHRFCGYVNGLVNNHLAYEPENTVYVSQLRNDWSELETVRRRIDAGVRAWVCANNYTGYILLERLAGWGISVPEDVSVTGFDETPVPAGLPKLTSVVSPEDFIGLSAVQTLLARAEHRNRPSEMILLEGTIVEGQTIAPPKR